MRELLEKIFNEDYGRMPENLKSDIETELAKPEPEPFGYISDTMKKSVLNGSIYDFVNMSQQKLSPWDFPVYTHPPAQKKPLNWDASGKEYDMSIHSNPDATAWADLFLETFPNCGADRGTMVGWFANAIMAMYDWKDRQQNPLSDDEIKQISEPYLSMFNNNFDMYIDESEVIEFARDIERKVRGEDEH